VTLIPLLILTFGAGLLVARLPSGSSGAPPAGLAPLTPTPIQPTPSPAPTATATSAEVGDALETVYIEIAPADWEKLAAKREEALQLGILLSDGGDYVPATLRHDQVEMPVELRLKGDWMDHLAHDKWSFRVRTVGENYIFGMRVFSLQDPSTRNFLNEWLFLENLRREGVLAVRYHFVHVVLNGAYKGIYALEEGFAKELFETQKRREGLIIRYDEDLVWEYRAFYDDQLIPRGVNEFYLIDEFQGGHVASTPELAAQRNAAIGLLRALWTGERPAAEVLDPQTMGKFLALTDLWSAPHGLIWHNLRYYYNPLTARLEPIGFDSDALTCPGGQCQGAGEPDEVGLPQSAFYRDPRLQAAYVEAAWQVSQPGYVEALQAELGPQFEVLRSVLELEFDPAVLTAPWDLLRRRQELLRQTLNPYQTVYAYLQQPAPAAVAVLQVGNLLDLPVEIVALEVNGSRIPIFREWLAPESIALIVSDTTVLVLPPLSPDAISMPYLSLVPDLAGRENLSELKIVTRLWGLTQEHQDPVWPDYPPPLIQGPLPERPTVAQALRQHPYLREAPGEAMLVIDGGTWEVNGDLVLPAGYGLRLAPGSTLRFGSANFILANGPLDFQGSADAPILLEPLADEWRGIVVLEAAAPSNWDYVTVEGVNVIQRPGWALTGGITFYRSPLHLDHSRLLNSGAEDLINVIRAEFHFVSSEFAHTVSDAFDADFGWGTITECSFHDIRGDAIDVSGSQVQVQRVKLFNIGDKGLSVGEASQLDAWDVSLENVSLGMASKDLSHATLTGATVVNARVAALAAYIKKAAYGPATLVARDVRFVDTPPERYALVQTGSWIELEGRRIEGVEVDVEGLYQP